MKRTLKRLPHARVNTQRVLTFQFDGRRYQGFEGDTLASALLANGVAIVGRSFKLHRPRGVFGSNKEEPNALVQLERHLGVSFTKCRDDVRQHVARLRIRRRDR